MSVVGDKASRVGALLACLWLRPGLETPVALSGELAQHPDRLLSPCNADAGHLDLLLVYRLFLPCGVHLWTGLPPWQNFWKTKQRIPKGTQARVGMETDDGE